MNVPVIVLYYNKVNLTQTCIDSILKAGCSPELIFAFNNGSKEIFHTKIQETYPGINHLGIKSNRGFSGGFNESLKKVFELGYNTAFFLTNDTTILPTTVHESFQKSLETGAGIIAPCVKYNYKPDCIHSIGGYFSYDDFLLHHYQQNDLSDIFNSNLDYIPGTALFITKEAFHALGGTDESYFMYWEDVDLSFRAHQLGIVQARAYSSIVYHGVGKTCHKNALYTSYYFNRNRLLFVKKFLSGENRKRALYTIEKELMAYLRGAEEKMDLKRIGYIREILKEL